MASNMDQMIEAVKAHALEHYDDGGWDVVVECWEDHEIAAALMAEDPVPVTDAQAIASFEIVVSIWAEQQADARNSAF